MSKRVAVFVDGYSVYHGITDPKRPRRHLLWLDYRSLFESQLKPDEALVEVVYYTSTGRRQGEGSSLRQSTYVAALRAHGGITVRDDGFFAKQQNKCSACGNKHRYSVEKTTDARLILDAYDGAFADSYDSAWIMSSDADFIPLIERLHGLGKRVCVLRPLGRKSKRLEAIADDAWRIWTRRWARCQLPDSVPDGAGGFLVRPDEWRRS
jgi:uncharacterized LabA/DUF88 family protein